MIATVTAPCGNAAGNCGEPVTVWLNGDEVTGYTPTCRHGQSLRQIEDEARKIQADLHSTRGGGPHAEPVSPAEGGADGARGSEGGPALAHGIKAMDQPPTTPDPDSGAVDGAATERAGAKVTTCWCGDHAFPTGHHVLICDSEAGRAKDAALRRGAS